MKHFVMFEIFRTLMRHSDQTRGCAIVLLFSNKTGCKQRMGNDKKSARAEDSVLSLA